MVILNTLNKLERTLFLKTAFQSLSVEPFLEKLEKHRGKGRNDYSIQTLWHSTLLMVGWNMSSYADLKKSLLCVTKMPSSFSFSRFITLLSHHKDELDQILLKISDPEEIISIGSFSFGERKLSYLWNVESGIPFLWEDGSIGEAPAEVLKRLLGKIPLNKIKFLLADAGYEPLAETLWRQYHIRPIIPLPKEHKETKLYRSAQYNEQGEIHCPKGPMVFAGFEESRQALKFRCAANHYGVHCSLYDTCSLRKNIRIPIKTNPRIFTPLPRFSYRWQRLWSMHASKPMVEKILIDRIPIDGKKDVFLRIASLLFAAAYRTKKLSNFPFS